jgi:RNA polymerase-binding protein DksA
MIRAMTTLTDTQRKQLRATLEARKEQLLTELDEVQSGHLQRAGAAARQEVDDLKEQADRIAGHTVRDAEARRDHDELVAVRAALQRLDDGSYGACVQCGEPVGVPRLLAQPSAARCINCQSQAEKQM